MNNLLTDKLIVDVDTGIDDALALLMLAKKVPERIIGVTTCGGNVGVGQTTKNTLAILELTGSSIPVFLGSKMNSLGEEYIFAYDYHGENGICNVNLPSSRKADRESAVEFIRLSAEKYAEELSFVCLAPPTNLAKALKKYPKIANKINSVVLMGGAVNVPGNQSEKAEFNFYQDPVAVDTILKNIKDVYIVPLDITNKCLIALDDIDKISGSSPETKFLKQAILNWYAFFGTPKKRSFELYDPLAASAVCGKFLKFNRVDITINTESKNRGALIAGSGSSVNCALDFDSENFIKMFYGSF